MELLVGNDSSDLGEGLFEVLKIVGLIKRDSYGLGIVIQRLVLIDDFLGGLLEFGQVGLLISLRAERAQFLDDLKNLS